VYETSLLSLQISYLCLAEFDATLQRLANADVQIDSLKQQLDDALGAEDMLVQLTERNLLLGEVRHLWAFLDHLNVLSENRGDESHNRGS
jgi:dynactin 1